MDGATGPVLKKDTVRVAEGRALIGGQARPASVTGEPGVRILQQSDAGAVIEVTCPCGRKTQVICDYAADSGPH